jgi:hypothetical protein
MSDECPDSLSVREILQWEISTGRRHQFRGVPRMRADIRQVGAAMEIKAQNQSVIDRKGGNEKTVNVSKEAGSGHEE